MASRSSETDPFDQIMRTYFWLSLFLSVFSCVGQQPPPTPEESKNMFISKADQLAWKGDWKMALEMLNKADSISPGDIGTLNAKAKMKSRLGDHTGAILDLHRAIGLCKDQRQCRHLYMTRAEVHKANGHMELACSDWKLAGALGQPDYLDHCEQAAAPNGTSK
jgi:tetratricopeptide (TPR) repeat protein